MKTKAYFLVKKSYLMKKGTKYLPIELTIEKESLAIKTKISSKNF